MWKILIADDEVRIRNGLKDLIGSFTDLDISICGMASNGQMALDMVRELRPDVLLADIYMPKLNGMEMLTQLYETESMPEVIVITGYDEFDFAKKAIKLGVSNYLLKPVDEEELHQSLQKALQRRDARIKNDHLKQLLEAQLEKNCVHLQRRFFKDWMEDSDVCEKELREEMKLLSIELPSNPAVLVVRTGVHNLDEPENLISENLILYSLEHAVNDIVRSCKPCYVFTDRFQNIIAIMACSEEALTVMQKECQNQMRALTMSDCSVLASHCTRHELIDTIRNLRNTLQHESSYHILVKQAKSYIMCHFNDNQLDLVQVSKKVGCNASYLSRLMKQEIGMSFKDFLSNLRIQKATELMHEDQCSFNQIAWQVGYSNQHYFSTAFKNFTGMTPSEYRRNLKSKEGGSL